VVKIYRTDKRPQWAFGEQIHARSLAGFGAPLNSIGDRQAHDPSPPSQSIIYYVAVTISGDAAVVGATQSYVATEDVSGLSARDCGHYLQLQWKWPERCASVVVAWRPDAYPQKADDRLAIKQRVWKGEYEQRGGFRIENPSARRYWFSVFAVLEVNGETIYSAGLRPGARAKLLKKIAIEYSIERPAWYRFDKRWKLILKAAQDVRALPEIVLIANPGNLQPLSVESGKVVEIFPRVRLHAGNVKELEFSLDGVARPVYLRLFFREQSADQQFELIEPSPAQLKVR
jgi:hypothetical protein